MMYMSSGIGCAVETCAAHASSGAPPPFMLVPFPLLPFIPVLIPSEPPLPLLAAAPALVAALAALPALPSLTELECVLEPHAAHVHAAPRTDVIPTATRMLRRMLQIEHQ